MITAATGSEYELKMVEGKLRKVKKEVPNEIQRVEETKV